MITIVKAYEEYKEFLKIKNKITTIRSIDYKFKNHIIPYFEKLKINEITEKVYIDFQIYLTTNYNYSESFYRQIHVIMKKLFDYLSMVYGIENIPAKIGIRKSNNIYISQQNKGTWTIKEYNQFIKKVDNKIYHALFNTLFYCGLRKGEALALKISDVQGNYLHINKSITKEFFNGQRQILTPKSKNSIRNVRLDFFMKSELKKLIKFYKKNYKDFNNDFFLFGGNKPISCTTLENKKNIYCDLAKVKKIRLHDFRHSHATMLYNNKIKIKLIQQRLGHADISTTMNTYVHSNSKEEKKLTQRISFIRF